MSVINVVLAILGAIGGIVWLVDQFKRQVRERAFYCVFPKGEEVIIVVPSLGQSGPNITMTFEDALACATVQNELARHGIHFRIKLHTQVTLEDRESNLFVIGGEVVNNLMAAVAVAAPLPVRAQMTTVGTQLLDRTGNVVHPGIRFGETDYAIIAVLSNPWSSARGKRLYLAAGAEGIGTWAAALQLAANTRLLRKRLQGLDISLRTHFEAVLNVRVRGHQLPTTSVMYATELG